MSEKELQKKEPVDVAIRKSGEAPVGFEEVDLQNDIIMPRVALLQGLSKMIIEDKGKIGDLANSLTKENFGKTLDFIPLFLFKTYVMFEPGKGLVMSSRNGLTITQASPDFADYIGKSVNELPEAQWDGRTPPKLSLVYNFPSLIVERTAEFPISLSLMRTSAGAAKNLISMARFTGSDIFDRKYRLGTSIESNDKGTYSVATIELLGKCSDEEYASAKKWYGLLRGKKIDVDMDEESPNFES